MSVLVFIFVYAVCALLVTGLLVFLGIFLPDWLDTRRFRQERRDEFSSRSYRRTELLITETKLMLDWEARFRTALDPNALDVRKMPPAQRFVNHAPF